jgi:hypothetical protein
MERGRFAAGNSFASGNPNHKRMYKLRRVLLTAVDDAAMERVTKKVVELAEGGDLEAVKILLTYTIGKPPQAIELSPSVSPHPFDRLSADEREAMNKRVDARLAEFDKRCLESVERLAKTPPPTGVNDAARARHAASRTPETPDPEMQ